MLWAIPIINKSQFLKEISVIDKLSLINFSNKCYDKFLMCLTKFFFLVSQVTKVFFYIFQEKQFTDSAVGLNETKKEILNCDKTLSTP